MYPAMTSFLKQFLRFQLKTENSQGSRDDTALDMIKLMCNEGNSVIYGKPEDSDIGIWILTSIIGSEYNLYGIWGTISKCSQYYTGAEFR